MYNYIIRRISYLKLKIIIHDLLPQYKYCRYILLSLIDSLHCCLGEYGVVFRGILDGGITPVAVKTLKGINRISRKLIQYNYNYR